MPEDEKVTRLSRFHFDAVVFDLDGILTRTARVHAAAWKTLFDAYRKESGGNWEPFDRDTDYPRHLDGVPRYDGVRNFLSSRGIHLPEGHPDDGPDAHTVYGLGNRKNRAFREALANQGVEVYEGGVELARSAKECGFSTAVVSSSRNCGLVLQTADLEDLFHARVDGVDAEELELQGKPAPDIFLEAARRVRATPQRTVVLEDALSGVRAARQGGFGLVIGVDRLDQSEALRDEGADLVIADLSYIRPAARPSTELPSALASPSGLEDLRERRKPALFLDYDGTLTPIVKDPARADLSEPMRRAVKSLAELCTVGVISGRDLKDVKARVDVEGITHAGSHGFEIEGPEHQHFTAEKAEGFLAPLDQAEAGLREQLKSVEGVLVERKAFSIAVHYRNVEEKDTKFVEKAVDQTLEDVPRLRKGHGKKVFELQPDMDWNKGQALLWVLGALDLDRPEVWPLYIGDDVTDEYAFGAVADRGGLAVLVAEERTMTEAHCTLKHPEEVRKFLETFADMLKQASS